MFESHIPDWSTGDALPPVHSSSSPLLSPWLPLEDLPPSSSAKVPSSSTPANLRSVSAESPNPDDALPAPHVLPQDLATVVSTTAQLGDSHPLPQLADADHAGPSASPHESASPPPAQAHRSSPVIPVPLSLLEMLAAALRELRGTLDDILADP